MSEVLEAIEKFLSALGPIVTAAIVIFLVWLGVSLTKDNGGEWFD